MNGGWASALRWDGAKGKLAYSAAHLRRGAGESQRPLWLFSRSAGCEHRVSSRRQDQHFPSPGCECFQGRYYPGPCRALWSWLWGLGHLFTHRGRQQHRGRLHSWQYLVVVGEFLTGRDTQLHGLHSHLLWHVRVLETGQG